MTATQRIKAESVVANVGATFRWEALNEEGTYYSNRTGHLIRLPEMGLKPGFSPVIEIVGKKPMTVTKLSDDPYLCISKARMLAADLDLAVNF